MCNNHRDGLKSVSVLSVTDWKVLQCDKCDGLKATRVLTHLKLLICQNGIPADIEHQIPVTQDHRHLRESF